jgi:hypothetical protein
MYLGVVMEQNRASEINQYYTESEVMMIDVMSLNNLLTSSVNVSCSELEHANVQLLDKVYNESVKLEDYENSGKLTEILKPVHQKYDILRSYLWLNSINIRKRCNDNTNTIVYLYNYSQTNIDKKAEQNVWSKLLYEVKSDRPNDTLLIPIAVDTNMATLNAMIDQYNITSLPAVVVNEKTVFRSLATKQQVLDSLN